MGRRHSPRSDPSTEVSEEVDNGPYLKLLSQLAQKFSEKEVREALYRALDAESIIHLLDSE